MRQFLKHKWVIGAGALVLVVALAAVAWAATDSSTTPTTAGVTPPTGPAAGGPGLGDMGGGGMMRPGRGGPGAAANSQQFQQNKAQRQANMQARQDAFLKLIRDKMSSGDKTKLDDLTATAKTQRDALDAARTSLMQTTSDLRALVDKYFPGGTTTDSGGAAAQPGSTNPSTPSAHTN
jgi:hypothetical protein